MLHSLRTVSLMSVVLAVCLVAFTSVSTAAQPGGETIVIQEGSVSSDTMTAPKLPTAQGGVAKDVPPFSGNRERLPAQSAIVEGGPGQTPNVVNYASAVTSRTPAALVINTTLSQPESDAVLSALANKIYVENGGDNYDKVTILWHVGANPEPAKPWGRTEINRGDTVFAVIRIQQ